MDRGLPKTSVNIGVSLAKGNVDMDFVFIWPDTNTYKNICR